MFVLFSFGLFLTARPVRANDAEDKAVAAIKKLGDTTTGNAKAARKPGNVGR